MNRFAKAALLSFFLSLCAAAIFVTHRVRESAPAPAPRDLFAVVNHQLAAFRAADFPSAYRQAATGVQQKFTLPQFEAMVRRDYAEMASARRVEFGSVKVKGATALVQVFLFAEDGSARVFLYSLIAEGGSWKVGEVEELNHFRPSEQLAGIHA